MMLLEVDFIEVLVNILQFLVPAGVVFGVSYYMINRFLDEQRKNQVLEFKKEHAKQVTPIRLQAYERLALFLDRISPENLILRLSRSGQTAAELRRELIQTVTDEFNHNISQQIYVSDQAWNMIKGVKEQIIGIVEQAFQESTEEETGPQLGKRILTQLMDSNSMLSQKAIEYLKKEIELAF